MCESCLKHQDPGCLHCSYTGEPAQDQTDLHKKQFSSPKPSVDRRQIFGLLCPLITHLLVVTDFIQPNRRYHHTNDALETEYVRVTIFPRDSVQLVRYAIEWKTARFAKVDENVGAVVVPRLYVDVIVLVVDFLLR